MRIAAGLVFASSLAASLLTSGAAWSQAQRTAAAPTPAAAPLPAAATPAPQSQPPRAPCMNPEALGVGRTVEIDTTGGPGFGFEHFKDLDFLKDHEVVLTFDDGPVPKYSNQVLQILADECVKATFFTIGRQAKADPEGVRKLAAAG
ncbi:MAG: polysaccharide deacetylase family protein, partial [Bradyrhizobium sp.]|nr:polysaccharide deacetylase family protein [Bradyrhizobium sp.]